MASICTYPRGYIYFAMAFSVMVEMFNLKIRRGTPVKLHQAHLEDALDHPPMSDQTISLIFIRRLCSTEYCVQHRKYEQCQNCRGYDAANDNRGKRPLYLGA